MANETEITPANSTAEELERAPAFPARSSDGAPDNGQEQVASQYRAIQAAQRLHEDTLRQLRHEIESQKQQISELSSGATSPSNPAASIEAVLLRLGELERKSGLDAPDPLINEIIHRLSAMESVGGRGGPDPRLDQVAAQVERLNRRASEPAPSDPRTDDVVLRVAAVEGSMKRAQEAFDAESVGERLEAIETAAEQAAQASQERIDQGVEGLETRIQELSDSNTQSAAAGSEVQQQIAALEQRIAAAVDTAEIEATRRRIDELQEEIRTAAAGHDEQPQFDAIAERMDALELNLRSVSDAIPDAEILERFEQLEQSITAAGVSDEVAALPDRIAQIESRLQDRTDDPRVDSIDSRLSAVEGRTSGMVGDEADALSALQDRLQAIEQQDKDGADPRAGGFEARVAMLEGKLAEAQSLGEALESLAARLDAAETRGPQAFESRIAEITGRLRSIELTTEADQGDSIERLSSRLDQIELTGGSDAMAKQLSELRQRVADLAASQESGTASASAEQTQLTEALARLASLEDKLASSEDEGFDPHDINRRLTVIEMNTAVVDEGQQLGHINERLAALEGAALGSSPASDPRVSALEQQLAELSRQAASTPAAGDASVDPAEIDSLRAQVAQLADKSAFDAPAQDVIKELAGRLESLERGGSQAGSSADADVATELGRRIDWLENRLDEGSSANPQQAEQVTRILDRLDTLESGSASGGEPGGVSSELIARFADLENRLQQVTSGDGAESGDAMSALQQESERWSQWARGTAEEVNELRQHVQTLETRDVPTGSPSGEASGSSSELLETLSEKISSGLANSEVKALRSQMYFVYFVVAMLVAMTMSLFFSS